MKNLFLLIAAFGFISCSASEEIQFNSLDQRECRSEMQISDQNQFLGETAENLTLYQQGNLIFASMDVRMLCNAKITFDIERNESRIKLKMKNSSASNDDCTCISNVTTSFKNLEAGTYTVMITNSAGSQLLAQSDITVQ
jgi:hypothetical protein